MSGDLYVQAFRDKQRIKDEEMMRKVHQLAFGSTSSHSILSATTTSNVSTLATTAATNIYATAGATSYKPYYKVDGAALFMDNKLKISAFDVYTICTDDSMYKFDDTSHISSSYAITEHFNVMHNDNLLTPGSRCKYTINDTKNVIKHLNFLTQNKFENIVQHKSSFPIGIIAHKWEKLHKELIWLNLQTH